MPNARLLAPTVALLVSSHARLAGAVCGDGIADPGEPCLQPPVFVDADLGAATHALTGEFIGPDGNLDVLLVRERTGGNDYSGYVGVLPGLGAAGLGPLVKWEFTDFTYGGPRSPSVADFDRDGLDDVVFVERGAMDFISSSYFVEVWRSNGDGTFARLLSHPEYATAVVAGDFDGDGAFDHALRRGSSDFLWPPAGVSAHGLELRLGDGAGGFSRVRIPTGTIPASTVPVLAAADLDLDGQDDLVTRVGNQVYVGVAFDGTDFLWLAFAPNPLPGGLVRIHDVNDDGAPDLVYQVNNNVVVVPGDGLGGLGAPVQSPIGVGINTPVALADFDLDGLLDYATTGFDGSFWLAPGLGTGAFAAPVMLHDLNDLGLMPSVSLGADIDGDGFADLLACFRDVAPTLDVYLSWSDP